MGPNPDGTRVGHRAEACEGVIDGLTEIVSGSERNPDRKTQYRVKLNDSTRLLVAEDHLTILLDNKNLVLIARKPELYRRCTTNRLRAVFAEDRFVRIDNTGPPSLRKRQYRKADVPHMCK